MRLHLSQLFGSRCQFLHWLDSKISIKTQRDLYYFIRLPKLVCWPQLPILPVSIFSLLLIIRNFHDSALIHQFFTISRRWPSCAQVRVTGFYLPFLS